jgi:hypothetical protein
MALATQTDDLTQHQQRFQQLSLAYQNLAAEAGVQIVAFKDPSLPRFSAKKTQERQEILHALSVCVKVCEMTRAQKKSLADSQVLVWNAIKEFGLRPPSDFFSYVTPDCVIELHSPEDIQLFRNFNFYRYCSYTLEELYSDSWDRLYDRPSSILQHMMAFVGKVYGGKVSSTVNPEIPTYHARELHSEQRYTVEVQWLWAAPLFQEGTSTPVATIAIEQAKIVG